MKKLLQVFKALFGWPLSFLAIFLIFKTIFSQKDIINLNFKDINLGLLILGIFCFLVYFFLRTYQWKRILKESGHDLPMNEVAFLWSFAEIRRFLPGKIWPFLGRTILFTDKGVNKKIILSSLVIETELLIIGTLITSLLSLPFIFQNLLPTFPSSGIIISASFIITAIIVFLYVNNKFLQKMIKNTPLNRFIHHILPDFSPKVNLHLILISITYMGFYGVANFFIVSSIISLSLQSLVSLSSFFVFSFLVGYLSFITPMGLGVREGIVTLGLSKVLSFSIAGIASVYSRIILIISELIFLCISYFWSKNKNQFKFVKNLLTNYRYETFLFLFIAIYVVYFSIASFLRYENFYAGRYDLGNMAQVVWNTMQGRIFQASTDDFNSVQIMSRLGGHADFILILLTPFYFIWTDPRMLLLIQTFIIGCGGIFVYLISKNVIKNKLISLMFGLFYLLNPGVNHTNLYDFHAVALATTFLLATFYFLIKKRYLLFLLFAFLSALTKEQVWVIISFFGVFLFLKEYSSRRMILSKLSVLGITIFIVSSFIFYYLINSAIPNARGENHFALSYYSEFGDSPKGIIQNLIFSPVKIFNTLLNKDRLYYLEQMFLPLGFLPFLSPHILFLALPDFAINVLSNNSNLYQIYFHYTSTITPFLFIASIYSLNFYLKKFPKIPLKFYVLFLSATTLYSAYSFGPLPFAKNPNVDMFTKPQPNKEIINKFLQNIDEKYSIAATNNIGSHLSHREKISTIPKGINEADIIVFLLNDIFAQPSLSAQKEMAKNLRNDKNYTLLFEKEDFVAFKKKKALDK